MRAVSGVDLVSAALQTSLARAQKRFNLSNPGSISKKKLKKEKKLENKLKKRFARFGKDPINQPLSSSSPGFESSDFSFGDWNTDSVKSFQIEFEPVQNEFSSFLSNLKQKYVCLNPRKKVKKVDKCVGVGAKVNGCDKKYLKNNSSCSETRPLLKSSPEGTGSASEKDDDVDSGLGLEIFPTNTISLLQQFRKKRLEARKEKKRKKKEAKLLEEQKLKFSKLKESKNKRMRDMMSISENGNGSSESQSTNPVLPEPKIVLYPRERIVQGWKQKHHFGCGFHNLGNSCYMNATLQALFHTPSFVNWLLHDEEHTRACRSNQTYMQCMVCAMASTLKDSLNRLNNVIRPIQVHNKLKAICKHFTHGRQEDAHEFLRLLLESMERSYLNAINALRIDNRSRETTPLGQIFGGYLRTEVTCLKCNSISTTFQPLAELQLDIRHVTTLEDAMNNHFKKERLDNNDYKCDKCHTLSPATKQFSLEVPPIVLCLQLKRFTLSGGKINKPIHCNQRLNLDRFLHKSLRQNHANVQYRLVGLVTHIGSSPNCGHYTAIAEASNGNFYQFDDSLVRAVSLQVALNTDAYVIIYEMEPNGQAFKQPHATPNGSPIPSSVNNFKPVGLQNGIKPSCTISRSDGSFPFEHKKITNPFLKTNIVKSSENGISKPSTPGNSQNRLLNGFNSPLSSTPSRERTTISFGFNKSASAGSSSSGLSSNPKILFKNPHAVIQPTSSYLTNSVRSSMMKQSEDPDSNESDTSLTQENGKSLAKAKAANSLSQIPRRIELPNRFGGTKSGQAKSSSPQPVFNNGARCSGIKTASTAKMTTNGPSKLVAYDTDEESDEKPPTDTECEPRNAEEGKKANQDEVRPPCAAPEKSFFPIFNRSIKTWAGNDSVLSMISGNRKRSLEKSKEDLQNEEFDTGKVKKSRNNSRSKSRSPSRESSRNADKTTPSPNKFQQAEDNRHSTSKDQKSNQHQTPTSRSSSSSKSPVPFPKPMNGYHNSHRSDDGSRRSHDRDSGNGSGSSGSSSASRSNSAYFARKGYNYKNNYGYDNFKRHNSNSGYYPSSNYSNSGYKFKNNYHSSHGGWRRNGGEPRYGSNSYYRRGR